MVEAADIGAIFSVFTALFVAVHAFVTSEKTGKGIGQAILRVGMVAVFAGIIAASFVFTMVKTNIEGVVGTGQDEATKAVHGLKGMGVDAIKCVMEAGVGGALYHRLDPTLLNAIGAAARADQLPFAVHTGNVRDVEDAIKAGANSIEHGSFQEKIPDAVFAALAKAGIAYDPTLYVGSAFPQFAAGKTDLLTRSLVQQVAPPKLLASTQIGRASCRERV
mgnify:CR=1 FL=1